MLRKLQLTLGATTMAGLIWLPLPAMAQTQITGGQAFLKAPSAQAGVRANGAFGSTSVPAGFNNNAFPNTGGSCLGFVIDRNKTGFAPGAQIDGDFFCPGSPFESWTLSVGGSHGINSDSATSIPGSLGGLIATSTTNSVTWTSTSAFNGISVQQVYSLSNVEQVLRTSVTLTNTTGGSISGINFARIVDPDNQTQPASPYPTTDIIGSQAPVSQVRSSFTNGALIALSTDDSRGVAAFNTGGSTTATAVVSGAGWERTVGATRTGDLFIGLGVAVGTLAAGQSTSFAINYPLTAQAAVAEIAPVPIPTMTEWTMILFGLVLAGGAALMAPRRRMTV